MISPKTMMLLLRYSNYRRYNFLNEHKAIIDQKGYVWMMKIGKKVSLDKINKIMRSGGFIILKSPISDGSKYYIGRFNDYSEKTPNDNGHMPQYYSIIMNDIDYYDAQTQFFKVSCIAPLKEYYANALVLEKSKRKVVEVVNETRTAVMYVENEIDFDIIF